MDQEDTKESVADDDLTVLTPSHILQDGQFVHLPEPSNVERSRFFERTIAKHGLIAEDLAEGKIEEEKDDDKKDDDEPRIHPLALASARLQGNGVNELNRAINLSGLVASKQYFDLTNIVDPSLDPGVEVDRNASGKDGIDAQEEQRLKSTYALKVKCGSFKTASAALEREKRRFESSIVAQAQPDKRLKTLRPEWRLVAPEHGTRALPHATRPTEVIAIDVDIYRKTGSSLGRLARRVPRYATVELKEDYNVDADIDSWRNAHLPKDARMDVDESESQSRSNASKISAEPFVIADPTLGKLDTDFDPKKVELFTLQMSIEKPGTGFVESHCLQPISIPTMEGEAEAVHEDSALLSALQHSLFCAKLFESIRRELAPDTEEIGQIRTTAEASSVVWLSCFSGENLLPSPHQTVNTINSSGQIPVSVIHCHEGEVMVQLDCEYTLRVKLLRAIDAQDSNGEDAMESGAIGRKSLRVLCKSLLLHAKESYHRYSVELSKRLSEQEREETVSSGHAVKKTETIEPPSILRTTVGLGAKMLFERRIRSTLKSISTWMQEEYEESLTIEWLPLSIFDQEAHFVISLKEFRFDVHIVREIVTITSFEPDDSYRKVQFHSDFEFDIYLRNRINQALS